MTDVHGEPQQGGYLPAEIWHAYMAAVTEGQPCVAVPESKEAISYQPFYGKYATTGEALDGPAKPPAPANIAKTATQARRTGRTRRRATHQHARNEHARAARRIARATPPAQHGADRTVDKNRRRGPGLNALPARPGPSRLQRW